MIDENAFKKVLLISLLIFNILFVSVFFVFVGFVFGVADSENKYDQGMLFGYKQGKYEVYLDLENRRLGRFDSEKDKFDFYEPLKKGK